MDAHTGNLIQENMVHMVRVHKLHIPSQLTGGDFIGRFAYGYFGEVDERLHPHIAALQKESDR